MKNIIKTLGIIAFIAIIGFAVTGCKEKQDSDLVYKWYESEALAAKGGDDYAFWFRSDGKVYEDGVDTGLKWSTKKKTLTLTGTIEGMTLSFSYTYKVSGKKLTLTASLAGTTFSGTLYRK